MGAFEDQVGGGHYKNLAIQPAEYCYKNNIGHMAGDAIAYITRYKGKNGVEDLRKAIHSLQLLIEMEEREEKTLRQNETQEQCKPKEQTKFTMPQIDSATLYAPLRKLDIYE